MTLLQILIATSVALSAPASGVVVRGPAEPWEGHSDSVTALTIRGDVTNLLSVSIAELTALPHHEEESTIHDRTATYRGVALGELLVRAGAPEGRDLLRSVVFARGTDGYEVVFALAELSADFTDRAVLIADTRDGEALPAEEGPIRLVVPWEKRGARSVRQITEIEVRILP